MEKVKGYTDPIIDLLRKWGFITDESYTSWEAHKSGGILRYGPIPISFFKEKVVPMLADENLQDAQNYGPSIQEVLDDDDFRAVAGYICSKDRSDERLTVETVYIVENRDTIIGGWVRGGDEVWYDIIEGENVIGVWYD